MAMVAPLSPSFGSFPPVPAMASRFKGPPGGKNFGTGPEVEPVGPVKLTSPQAHAHKDKQPARSGCYQHDKTGKNTEKAQKSDQGPVKQKEKRVATHESTYPLHPPVQAAPVATSYLLFEAH